MDEFNWIAELDETQDLGFDLNLGPTGHQVSDRLVHDKNDPQD